MATVVPTIEQLGVGVQRITWASMGSGDDGAWMSGLAKYPNKTVEVSGAAVTAVDIQGKDAGGTARVLNDSRGEGNALTFSAADIREVLENTDSIRPLVTTGTTVTVRLTVGG
jgi:hypothetical protein